MNIKVEPYGDKIGVVENGLKDFIEKKEAQLLVTLQDDEHKSKHQFILCEQEALCLFSELDIWLNGDGHRTLQESGFRFT